MRGGFWSPLSGLAEAMHNYQWEGESLAACRGEDDDYEVCATAQSVKYYKPSVAEKQPLSLYLSQTHSSMRHCGIRSSFFA